MTEKTTEEKINDLHDFCIRMEPFIKRLDKIDNAVFNDGWGIASQVKVLWVIIPCAWAAFLVYIRNK